MLGRKTNQKIKHAKIEIHFNDIIFTNDYYYPKTVYAHKKSTSSIGTILIDSMVGAIVD